MIGIYKIENIINHKIYIGQSKNVYGRWKEHKKSLNSNNHVNDYLQKSWNKYGKNNFIFSIVEECLESELNDKEIYWINYYNSFNNGFNLTKGGNRNDCSSEYVKNKIRMKRLGIKLSEETKKLISEHSARKGKLGTMKGKHLTEEQKRKIIETKEKNGTLHKTTSQKQKDAVKKANTGIKKSSETIERMKIAQQKNALLNKKGTIFINNGFISKVIHPELFEVYKKEGWEKGRLCHKH